MVTTTHTRAATNTPVLAAVFSVDHQLAARPRCPTPPPAAHRTPAPPPRNHAIRDRDAVLCLVGATRAITGQPPRTTVDLSTGDDPAALDRAVEMHAAEVLDLDDPADVARLRELLAHHLGPR